jgi:hypothetical protein
MAPDGNRGPHTLTSTYGTITVTGQGRGIQCVAETVAHELHHLALYSRSGWFPFWQDDDRDDVDNSDEPHLDGIKSDALNADTYNVATATRKPEYSVYGDNEVRCRKIEMTHSIGVYPTLDWANPGCQTFNRFGPKP